MPKVTQAESAFELRTSSSWVHVLQHFAPKRVEGREQVRDFLKEAPVARAQSINTQTLHRGRKIPGAWRCLHSVAQSPEHENGITQSVIPGRSISLVWELVRKTDAQTGAAVFLKQNLIFNKPPDDSQALSSQGGPGTEQKS